MPLPGCDLDIAAFRADIAAFRAEVKADLGKIDTRLQSVEKDIAVWKDREKTFVNA